ncbi:hypothetical protein JKP88DRAFT_301989 [Tribonema minus]|uniref:EF-hand domain-containing protein n=1 Tax=Tribonema minus TaxID=303371 RepID=A0A835ZBK9_9STRA|nr:hypothetical protein JKP88DRAFT_301989 [Tribonema minus]
MEAQEPDDFVKQKYSRDDETPKPWPISKLADYKPDDMGFYAASEFGVLTKLIQQPKHMKFPHYVRISRNHFDRGWGFKTYRRIKNVIVLLDWTPESPPLVAAGTQQSITGTSQAAAAALAAAIANRKVTPEQEQRLRKAFGMYDGDGDGRLNQHEFTDVLRALDVGVDDPGTGVQTLMSVARDAGVSTPLVAFDQVKEMMRRQAYIQVERGRTFVALCLAEAESLRGVLHLMQSAGQPLVYTMPAAVCMRLTNGVVLDDSVGYAAPGKYQLSVVEQCFRFMDSEVNYNETEVAMLLRGVQDNDRYLREAWFMDVRACRRRVQGPVGNMPVARMFALPDEYHLLDYRATISAVKRYFKAKRLVARDAFAAFNSSHSGALTCSELYGGLVWLGMRADPALVHDIVRTVDLNSDGYVSWDEFKKAFGEPDEDADGDADARNRWPTFEGLGEGGDAGGFTVPPKPMAELYEQYSAAKVKDLGSVQTVEEMKAERLEAFKVKVQKHEKLDRVWTTHGTGARAKASIWAPDVGAKKLMTRNRIRVVLGHFARPGLSGFGRKDADIEPLVVEVTDTGKSGLTKGKKLDVIVDTLFPHPVRFREVWKQEGGDKPLYVWRPVPPSSAFVVLGMIATTSEEQPSLDSVRCIPRRWAKPAEVPPKKIWDDSGTGGRPGSFWLVNSMHCLHAFIGHDSPPPDDLFDLKNHRFFLSHEEVADIEASNGPAGGGGQGGGAPSAAALGGSSSSLGGGSAAGASFRVGSLSSE